MNQKELQKVLEQRINELRMTLEMKADEYADKGDRLANFKMAAGMMGGEPEEALMFMVSKHITALAMWVRSELPTGFLRGFEFWEEKIGDIMAYMVLFDGLLQERFNALDKPTVEPLPTSVVKKKKKGGK